MIRKYIGRIRIDFTDSFQTETDSQVFLGMIAHAQAVGTRPSFSSTRPGYEYRPLYEYSQDIAIRACSKEPAAIATRSLETLQSNVTRYGMTCH